MNTGKAPDNIKLAAVGDIGLHGKVGSKIKEFDPGFPFKFVKDEFTKHDIIFGNLEIPFSERGEPFFKYETKSFFAEPEAVNALAHAYINVLNLANNHILECGSEGLNTTIKLLEQKNIKYFGAGQNIEAARKGLILNLKNITIGFLGYSTPDKQSASNRNPGAAPLKMDLIEEDIKKIREIVDILIISLHFGMTYIRYPNEEGISIARKIIDTGADLILGHHPHVVQGIEAYKNKLIVYSMGEFIFDPTKGLRYSKLAREERRKSFIFSCMLNRNGVVDYKLIPTYLNDEYQPSILHGQKAEEMLFHVNSLSGKIGKVDFYRYAGSKVVNNEMELFFLHLKKLNIRALVNMLVRIRKRHLLLFYGFIKSKIAKKESE